MNPPRLPLAILPTPLQKLEALSADVGRDIWVKRDDLTGGITTGNKIRKLEFVLAQALAEGANIIVTCGGIQSNHCRATAFLAAKQGLKAHLLLRGERPKSLDGNLFLDHLAGAEISYFSRQYYQAHLDFIVEETLESWRKKGYKPYFVPTGASDGVGVWGYYHAATELVNDFKTQGITPDSVVVATGSGGTQAGLTAGLAAHRVGAPVIGMAVCDDEAWFVNKVRNDIEAWSQRYQMGVNVDDLDIRVNDSYIGPGYARATAEVFDTITRVARSENLVLDPVYTGKAFYGLLSELAAGRIEGSGPVVFVHTGGLFGLFAQQAECLKHLR